MLKRKRKFIITPYLFFILLILIGISIGVVLSVKFAIPYLRNEISERVVDYKVFFSDKIPGYVYVKLESRNAFVAGHPINITIATGIVNLTYLQITIEGASQYFPGEVELDRVGFSYFETIRNKTRNIIPLKRNITPVSNIITFSGKANNLIFGSGGYFDLGLTFARSDGNVVGYEVGMRDYEIKDAIYIAPREVLVNFRSNNLLIGLGYLAIGLSLFITGINGILMILSRIL